MAEIEFAEVKNDDVDGLLLDITVDGQSWQYLIDEVFEKMNKKIEYNDGLEWAANWITGAQMLGRGAEVEKFAHDMAMSIRAAKDGNVHSNLEEMIDRMSEKIVDKDKELHYLRRKNYELDHDKGLLVERIANLERMITKKS